MGNARGTQIALLISPVIALVLALAGRGAKRDLVELMAPILGSTLGGNIAV